MSSEDYLIRQFQQLAIVLGALIGLREKKKYQQAIDEIDQVLNSWYNLDAERIAQLSAQELNVLIFSGENTNFEEENAVAELIYQKAIIYKEMEKKIESVEFATKAMVLFRTIDQKGGVFSVEIQQRIAELDQMIQGT